MKDHRNLSAASHPREPLRCPVGKRSRLREIDPSDKLTECFVEETLPCAHSISYGSRFFCRLLWQKHTPQ